MRTKRRVAANGTSTVANSVAWQCATWADMGLGCVITLMGIVGAGKKPAAPIHNCDLKCA